jgi:hypothetical protein
MEPLERARWKKEDVCVTSIDATKKNSNDL